MRTGGRLASIVVVMAATVAACAAPAPPAPSLLPDPTPYPSGPAVVPATSQGPEATQGPEAIPPPEPTPTPGPTPLPATALPGGWSLVGEEPCPDDSEFTCVTLSVPRDHFAAGGPTWNVDFAIRRATGPRVGTFVVITGGPGSSGIAVADAYTSYYPASIPRRFDIVFIDQRGIGDSHPITCPDATAVYYASDEDPADPEQAEAFGAAAQAYVQDCLAEAGADPADLPFYGTRHAVEDLEAIREYLGVEQLHLYGESYGTQYAQVYAAAYPERIATLYLDGPVDLTLDGATYLAEATRTFEATFLATLEACAADPACARDMEGGDPLAAYEALASRLDEGPITFDFPKGDGTSEPRTFTAADLENAAAGYVYATTDRFLLLRALAAASDGNLVPLARIGYASIAVDPDTLDAIPDPGWSDALYYAVECQDYVYQADEATDADRLAGFLDDARVLGVDESRFGSVYYSEAPCLSWPNRPAVDTRPAPIVGAPYPTIVLVATTDPITPVANAIRIANRLRNGHVIIQDGGPHVIFGWGQSCPDDLVADWMVDGRALEAKVTVCGGSVVDDYVPIARDAEADYADGADFMDTLVAQVLNSDDYLYELDEDPIRAGCDFGGVLVYTPGDVGTGIALEACELTDGVPVTGTGSIDDESGTVRLQVTIPDGELRYVGDGYGDSRVTGTFRGEPVAD